MRTLPARLFLTLCVAILSGCASLESNDSETLKAKADSDFAAYIECMKAATANYLTASATAYEIADAAQSKCGAAFHELENSLQSQLTYGKVTKVGYSAGIESAQRLAQDLKISAKEKVVQWVIESRARGK